MNFFPKIYGNPRTRRAGAMGQFFTFIPCSFTIQVNSKYLYMRHTAACTGRSTRKGHLRGRITVTLLTINFSTCILAQIVENRETLLSSPILGPGDNFFEKLL
jgi:hypothetical protein